MGTLHRGSARLRTVQSRSRRDSNIKIQIAATVIVSVSVRVPFAPTSDQIVYWIGKKRKQKKNIWANILKSSKAMKPKTSLSAQGARITLYRVYEMRLALSLFLSTFLCLPHILVDECISYRHLVFPQLLPSYLELFWVFLFYWFDSVAHWTRAIVTGWLK